MLSRVSTVYRNREIHKRHHISIQTDYFIFSPGDNIGITIFIDIGYHRIGINRIIQRSGSIKRKRVALRRIYRNSFEITLRGTDDNFRIVITIQIGHHRAVNITSLQIESIFNRIGVTDIVQIDTRLIIISGQHDKITSDSRRTLRFFLLYWRRSLI